MYADTITGSMARAISETERRRGIQDAYNKAHGIVPKTVKKGIRDLIELGSSDPDESNGKSRAKPQKKMSVKDKNALADRLEKEMKEAARQLEFEKAAFLRDRIKELRNQK